MAPQKQNFQTSKTLWKKARTAHDWGGKNEIKLNWAKNLRWLKGNNKYEK